MNNLGRNISIWTGVLALFTFVYGSVAVTPADAKGKREPRTKLSCSEGLGDVNFKAEYFLKDNGDGKASFAVTGLEPFAIVTFGVATLESVPLMIATANGRGSLVVRISGNFDHALDPSAGVGVLLYNLFDPPLFEDRSQITCDLLQDD